MVNKAATDIMCRYPGALYFQGYPNYSLVLMEEACVGEGEGAVQLA